VAGGTQPSGAVEQSTETPSPFGAVPSNLLPAVVPGADAAQEGTLSAFVVVESGAAPFDVRELRDFCRLALPAYMIPKAIRTVDRLPVTPNGKTDKAALTRLLVAVG
jgi:acyl-coenzyme A synthetase/AMP-(fatty) acid ligase